jgi:hypothetical protein
MQTAAERLPPRATNTAAARTGPRATLWAVSGGVPFSAPPKRGGFLRKTLIRLPPRSAQRNGGGFCPRIPPVGGACRQRLNADPHAPPPPARSTTALPRSGRFRRRTRSAQRNGGGFCPRIPPVGGACRQRLNADPHAPPPPARSTTALPRSGRFGRGTRSAQRNGGGFCPRIPPVGGACRQRLNANPHAPPPPARSTTALPRSGRFGRGTRSAQRNGGGFFRKTLPEITRNSRS